MHMLVVRKLTPSRCDEEVSWLRPSSQERWTYASIEEEHLGGLLSVESSGDDLLGPVGEGVEVSLSSLPAVLKEEEVSEMLSEDSTERARRLREGIGKKNCDGEEGGRVEHFEFQRKEKVEKEEKEEPWMRGNKGLCRRRALAWPSGSVMSRIRRRANT